jgi:hypothetical protein
MRWTVTTHLMPPRIVRLPDFDAIVEAVARGAEPGSTDRPGG